MFSVEICAGAGGQALGLEKSGFSHLAAIEIDADACKTLRHNRPHWAVFEQDISTFSGLSYRGAELLAGGLPCPPFSKASKQLGEADERNLFPAGLRLIDEIRPKAVMFENVKGFLDPRFIHYRDEIQSKIQKMGYSFGIKLFNASDFGVPQLRPRVVIIAIENSISEWFEWPVPISLPPISVGNALYSMLQAKGWQQAASWREKANSIAPTIVGGSKKHGGPDLGPTRAKQAWAAIGVDGMGIADSPPQPDFVGNPRLTVEMVARLQGFPDDWHFCGRKTSRYRQVGNAFPPPVAEAVGNQIIKALSARKIYRVAS